MYITNSDEEEKYSLVMDALKSENELYKKMMWSKSYKLGKILLDWLNGITSLKKLRKNIWNIDYSLRWRLLCKKFPIKKERIGINKAKYVSNKKFVVYTCIFGKYDYPREPLIVPNNCEYYIITDQSIPKKSKWKRIDVRNIIPEYDKLSNAERNRFCKMLPFFIFDADYSIYIDGNIKVITDLTEFINLLNSSCGMALHKHKSRICVYDEIEACKILKKSSKSALELYKNKLKNESFPRNYGMLECNVIVRDHSNMEMQEIMKEWWNDFLNNEVKRDQLSLPYILWKRGISISEVCSLGNNVEYNHAIRVCGHI